MQKVEVGWVISVSVDLQGTEHVICLVVTFTGSKNPEEGEERTFCSEMKQESCFTRGGKFIPLYRLFWEKYIF